MCIQRPSFCVDMRNSKRLNTMNNYIYIYLKFLQCRASLFHKKNSVQHFNSSYKTKDICWFKQLARWFKHKHDEHKSCNNSFYLRKLYSFLRFNEYLKFASLTPNLVSNTSYQYLPSSTKYSGMGLCNV